MVGHRVGHKVGHGVGHGPGHCPAQVLYTPFSQTNTFGMQNSLCYSIIKSCSYWNSNTLAVFVDNGKIFLCDNLSLNERFSPADLPKSVEGFGAEVVPEVSSNSSEGVLSDSLGSKLLLQNIIVNNSECTGFLMWFSCYCISCIFTLTKKSKYLYCLLAYNENHVTPIQHSKDINGTASVAEAISEKKKCESPGHYKIQFSTCSSKNGDQNKRKKIMKNQRQNQNYETMEPSKKRRSSEKQQVKDTTKKQGLQIKKAKKKKNGRGKQTRATK